MTDKPYCIWDTDECSNEITDEPFYGTKIKVSVCSNHLNDHRNIMFLHNHGYEVEDILAKGRKYMSDEVEKIKQAEGVDNERTN